jgi:hypothetical protein
MTDSPITLDRHRGMAAQKATEIRRLIAEVEANEKSLRDRQEELKHSSSRLPPQHGPRLPRRPGICSVSLHRQQPHRTLAEKC